METAAKTTDQQFFLAMLDPYLIQTSTSTSTAQVTIPSVSHCYRTLNLPLLPPSRKRIQLGSFQAPIPNKSILRPSRLRHVSRGGTPKSDNVHYSSPAIPLNQSGAATHLTKLPAFQRPGFVRIKVGHRPDPVPLCPWLTRTKEMKPGATRE